MVSEQEAHDFLAIPAKELVRPMAWVSKQGNYSPALYEYTSAVRVSGEIPEGIIFRARFRDRKVIQQGVAAVELPAFFSAALQIGSARISAIDTNPGQLHTNSSKIGAGKPFYGQAIDADTHVHIWVGEYGYVEPIAPPLLDLQTLLAAFYQLANIVPPQNFVDPLSGQQGILDL